MAARGDKIGRRLADIEDSLAKARERTAQVRAGVDPTLLSAVQHQTTAAAQVAVLRRDLDRREQSYAAREAEHEQHVQDLESQIVDLRQKLAYGSVNEDDRSMDKIHELHREVLNNLNVFEDRSASIVRDRERDLTRACRARMSDSNKELTDLLKRRESGVRIWKQRVELLEKERRWAIDLCSKLGEHNSQLTRENAELQACYKKGEEKRKFLISKLAKVKKDTGRCHQVAEHLDRKIAALTLSGSKADNDETTTHRIRDGAKTDSRVKCLEELKHLERLLDHQQKKLLAMRTACVMDAQESVSLQRLIRQRILDVSETLRTLQDEQQRQQQQPQQHVAAGDATAAVKAKNDNNKKATTAAVASQDDDALASRIAQLTWEGRILTILYEKAFPIRRNNESEHRAIMGLPSTTPLKRGRRHSMVFQPGIPLGRTLKAPAPQDQPQAGHREGADFSSSSSEAHTPRG